MPLSDDIGSYGEELYEQVLPLHGPDPEGFAHDYIGAVVHGALEIDALVRDNERGPGWGDILDSATCPSKGLPWLSQIAGVDLRPPRVVTPRSNLFPFPSFEATNPTYSAPGGAAFFVEDGMASRGTHMVVLLRFGATNTSVRFTEDMPVVGGKPYTYGVDILLADFNCWLFINWYDGASSLIVQETDVAATTVARRVMSTVAPADAVTAQVGVALGGTVIGQAVILDGVTFEQATTDGSYFDGDSLYGSWSGTPHESVSSIGGFETEEEWAVYARAAIVEQSAKRRGSPGAILSAARDTLTGSKSARLLERVGGNAYRLTLVTRPSETPDPARTYAAAKAQVAIGRKLTHTLSEGAAIDEGTKSIDSVAVAIDSATLPDIAD